MILLYLQFYLNFLTKILIIMKVDYINTKLFIIFFSLLISLNVAFGQTINEVKEAFNNGVSAIQSNSYEEAITQFNTCLEMYSGLDEEEAMEGEDMVLQIESKLPTLHYQVAMDFFQAKELDKAIDEFEKTVEVANKYDNEPTLEKAQQIIPQLYYQKAGGKYKNKNLEGALGDYNKATELNPEYEKAYYMKSLIYKKMGDDASFIESTRKAIEYAEQNDEQKVVDKAKQSGSKYFLKKGNEAKSAEQYDDAKKYLILALEFDGKDAMAYYLLATVNNLQKNYDAAIEATGKALEFESDDAAKKARIYFEMANALKEKGENDRACAAYKNASYGAYKAAAEYQIVHVLKCE